MKNCISRRSFLKAAGILGAAGALAACGGSSASTSTAASTAGSTAASAAASSTSIKLWTYPIGGWGNDETVQGLVSSFNAKYPDIKVTVEYLDYTNGDDQVNTAIEGGSAPDLIMEGPERLVANWGAKGVMAPLNDLWTDDARRTFTDRQPQGHTGRNMTKGAALSDKHTWAHRHALSRLRWKRDFRTATFTARHQGQTSRRRPCELYDTGGERDHPCSGHPPDGILLEHRAIRT